MPTKAVKVKRKKISSDGDANGEIGMAKKSKKRVSLDHGDDLPHHSGQVLKLKRVEAASSHEMEEPITEVSKSAEDEITHQKLLPKKHAQQKRRVGVKGVKKPAKLSTKEQLSQMNKRERKAFLKSLAEKHKPNFHIAQRAKVLWEKIRSSRTEASEKESSITDLRALVKGKAKTLIYAHDTCRVIECLLALKRDDITSELFDELSAEIVPMTKSLYAKFFVAKLLKYGSKEQRDQILAAFRGHCVRMLSIRTSAKILETAFNDYANAEQRTQIVGEFYGPEYALLTHELCAPPSLALVAKSHPTVLIAVMRSLETALEKAVRKETLKLSLTHRLLLDYLNHCSADQMKSVVETVKENLPEIVHTREGSRAAMTCIWLADAEERKAIVKSFKGLAVKSSCDEFGRRALFALFDCVDDTQLMHKYITKEIANNIGDISRDKFGVWVLHYLVHPRDYRVFGKGIVEMLKQGDAVARIGEKSPGERYGELFNHIRAKLFDYLTENMRAVIFDKVSSVLILDVLEPDNPSCPLQRLLTKKEKRTCFDAIAEIVADELDPGAAHQDSPHIIKAGCGRFVLRKLLQVDSKQEGVKLSDSLAKLPIDHLSKFIAINSGCFALLEMLQSGSTKARAKLAELDSSQIAQSELIGAKALREELERTTY